MNKFTMGLMAIVTCFSLGACTKSTPEKVKTALPGANAKAAQGQIAGQSISIHDANVQIASYLQSINYPANDSSVRTMMMDANTLRTLLADTSIKNIGWFMAHDAQYATDHYGQFAGYNHLSMVVVGVNSDMHVVPNSNGGVDEHICTCPGGWCCVEVNGNGTIPE